MVWWCTGLLWQPFRWASHGRMFAPKEPPQWRWVLPGSLHNMFVSIFMRKDFLIWHLYLTSIRTYFETYNDVSKHLRIHLALARHELIANVCQVLRGVLLAPENRVLCVCRFVLTSADICGGPHHFPSLLWFSSYIPWNGGKCCTSYTRYDSDMPKLHLRCQS